MGEKYTKKAIQALEEALDVKVIPTDCGYINVDI